MTRTISPPDDTPPAPEAIPDRSALAKLYERPQLTDKGFKPTDADRSLAKSGEIHTSTFRFRHTLIINLLAAGSYVISFLSIVAIYSLGPVTDPTSALENRLAMTALTIPALVPLLLSIRIAKNMLADYRVQFIGLLSMYLLFILPILNLTITLRTEHGTPDFITLPVTFVLSQIYIWLIAYAFKSKNVLSTRLIAPAILVMAIIFCVVIL